MSSTTINTKSFYDGGNFYQPGKLGKFVIDLNNKNLAGKVASRVLFPLPVIEKTITLARNFFLVGPANMTVSIFFVPKRIYNKLRGNETTEQNFGFLKGLSIMISSVGQATLLFGVIAKHIIDPSNLDEENKPDTLVEDDDKDIANLIKKEFKYFKNDSEGNSLIIKVTTSDYSTSKKAPNAIPSNEANGTSEANKLNLIKKFNELFEQQNKYLSDLAANCANIHRATPTHSQVKLPDYTIYTKNLEKLAKVNGTTENTTAENLEKSIQNLIDNNDKLYNILTDLKSYNQEFEHNNNTSNMDQVSNGSKNNLADTVKDEEISNSDIVKYTEENFKDFKSNKDKAIAINTKLKELELDYSKDNEINKLSKNSLKKFMQNSVALTIKTERKNKA